MISVLTNHIWQSTLFAIVAGLLSLAFRKNRAQVRYWLWFSVSLKFFIPFTLLIILGSRLEFVLGVSQITAPAISIAIAQIAQPFPDMPSTAYTQGAAADWTLLVVFGAWLAGFLTIASMRLRVWLRIRAVVRRSIPLEIPDVEFPAGLKVRSSAGLLEPGVVGWLRPVLLLPAGIMERLPQRQLNAVLAHEMCHVRRRDNLTSAIHMIVEAIFWFHPFVWWIGARLVDERERACDEEVLRLGNAPQDYSEGILNVCKIYLMSPLRCVSGVTGSDLKKRIQGILAGRVAANLSFAKKAALLAAGMMAVAAPVSVGMVMTVTQSQPPVETATQAAARDALNKGIRSYREGRFLEAVVFFEGATRINPTMQNAYLYLATAYAQLFVAGVQSADNKKYSELAIQIFSKELQKDPRNVHAHAGLASIYQKDNQLQKARESYLRNAELDPPNPVPQFGVGNIDLAIVAERNSTLSTAEKAKLIEEGLQYLNQALMLNPDYDEAMSTVSLLYRQKAAIVDTENEKIKLEGEASSWEAKSLQTRKKSAESKKGQTGSN